MNHYPHHIGDYLKDTAHLTLIEDGAYRRLMDLYYQREQPLPGDRKQVYRLVRATTATERKAIDTVLAEFFSLTPDGFRQCRCDEEISIFQQRSEDADEKRENERERQRRHRERRKELFAALRGYGVVPPWDAKTTELETLLSQYKNRPVTRDSSEPVTRTATAIPIANNQEPITNSTEGAAATPPPRAHVRESPPPPDAPEPGKSLAIPDEAPARATQLAVLLRRNGADARTHAGSKGLAELVAMGATDAQVLMALETAKLRRKDSGGAQPVTAAYLVPMVAELRAPGPPPGRGAGRYAEDIRQMREMSAWADQQIRESQGAPRQSAEIDMGAIDATDND